MRQPKNLSNCSNRYNTGNREAALAILEQPERHLPVLVEWARAFLAKDPVCQQSADLPESDKPRELLQGQLFTEMAA